jgi:hypothetical protein
MKTKRIISIALVVVMCFCAVAMTGCSKDMEPSERFFDALSKYEEAVTSNNLYKVLSSCGTNGSIGISAKAEDLDIDLNATIYMNEASKSASAVVDFKSSEQDFNVSLGLNNKQMVIASKLIEEKYGMNLENVATDFPKSIFGTQGANLLGLTEEIESELLAQLKEIIDTLNAEQEEIEGTYFKDLFIKYATFETDETPYVIHGEETENITVTATIKKPEIKQLIKELTEKAKVTDEDIAQLIDVVSDSNPEFENVKTLDGLLDKMLEDFQDTDTILSIALVLDEKTNGIMAFEVEAGLEYEIIVTLSADPENIEKVAVICKSEGDTSKYSIKITDDATKYCLEVEKEGEEEKVIINCDKAHKTITLNTTGEDAEEIILNYTLSESEFSLATDADGVALKFTFKSKDESPVDFNNFKDILKLSAEEFTKLAEDLQKLLPEYEPELEPDSDEDVDLGNDDFDFEFDEDGFLENPDAEVVFPAPAE